MNRTEPSIRFYNLHSDHEEHLDQPACSVNRLGYSTATLGLQTVLRYFLSASNQPEDLSNCGNEDLDLLYQHITLQTR
ncbi:hypothetical protein KP79_PYT07343 [Mizuhopecten yessoensis]|uniref:Uncharacterized protein n=1 Tax=Mizuhopecten yessoensis TaxID=6573 RepID=A0A210Q5E9_MIZYE|nr:hypothetical protein KP79_PYT07343 [Mizuhopecten yessoensis]